MAFTPDGRYILTTSDDSTLRLWTLEYGAVMRRFPHADRVRDVAYNPLDSRIALSSEPGALHLWNLESGEEIRQIAVEGNQTGVAYSPDGKTALSAVEPGDDSQAANLPAVIQWELESGEEILRLAPGREGQTQYVTFSPNGRLALSSGEPAFLWDLTTGEVLQRFNRYTDSVAFSPDGQRAITGGDLSVYLWDLATGDELLVMDGHTAVVFEVAFLPDGKTAIQSVTLPKSVQKSVLAKLENLFNNSCSSDPRSSVHSIARIHQPIRRPPAPEP